MMNPEILKNLFELMEWFLLYVETPFMSAFVAPYFIKHFSTNPPNTTTINNISNTQVNINLRIKNKVNTYYSNPPNSENERKWQNENLRKNKQSDFNNGGILIDSDELNQIDKNKNQESSIFILDPSWKMLFENNLLRKHGRKMNIFRFVLALEKSKKLGLSKELSIYSFEHQEIIKIFLNNLNDGSIKNMNNLSMYKTLSKSLFSQETGQIIKHDSSYKQYIKFYNAINE